MTSKRVFSRILAAVLVVAALAVSLTAFGSGGNEDITPQKQTDAGVAVEVETVETASISNENRVSGRVSADAQTPVMIATNAQVTAVYVEVGDTVQAGDPICALDLSSTVASYNAAVISRNSAYQSYNDQSAVFNTQIALYDDQGDLIQSQIEFYQSQVEFYNSQIESGQSQVELAQSQSDLAQSQIDLAQSQIASYESQITVTESQITQAEKNVRDTQALMEAGAASQAELDQAKMSLDQAQVSLGQLQLAREQAQVNLEQARLGVDQAQLGVEQAQLGVDQIQLTVDQTQIGLEQAQYELSQIDLARLSTQAQRNSTLSQLEAGAQSYQANVDQLAAVLATVDGNGNVLAPVSGVITSLSAVERGMVSATSPVAVIDEVEQMKVTVSVSETLAPKIAVGDTVDVSIGAVGVGYAGIIRNAERVANAQTGLYGVTVSVPADMTDLLPGMFADVTFYTNTSNDAIVVPTEAILSSGSTQYVFVVEDGTAIYTEVTTGLVGSGVTEILTGLSKGQQLVTVGQSYLHDGDPVRLVSREE